MYLNLYPVVPAFKGLTCIFVVIVYPINQPLVRHCSSTQQIPQGALPCVGTRCMTVVAGSRHDVLQAPQILGYLSSFSDRSFKLHAKVQAFTVPFGVRAPVFADPAGSLDIWIDTWREPHALIHRMTTAAKVDLFVLVSQGFRDRHVYFILVYDVHCVR